MILHRLRRSGAPVALIGIVVLLATLLPSRPARADDPEVVPQAEGSGGPTSLSSAPPYAGASSQLATVDLSTGGARSRLPFDLPTARGRAQPSLGLVYDSAAGVGFAGLGWTLDVPAVTRGSGSGIPRFIDADPSNDAGDEFTFSGQHLVPICVVGGVSCSRAYSGEVMPSNVDGWTYFRPEVDDFTRFFWSPDHQTWRVQLKSGVELYFGVPSDDPANHEGLERDDGMHTSGSNTNVYRWLLVRQVDPFGNAVVYKWQAQGVFTDGDSPGLRYLTDIYDTAPPGGSLTDLGTFAHHVHLNWDGSSDLTVLAQTAVWRHFPTLHLVGVDVTSVPISGTMPRSAVRRYRLSYISDQAHLLLHRIELEGACAGQENAQSGLLVGAPACDPLPATVLDYTTSDLAPADLYKTSQWLTGPLSTGLAPHPRANDYRSTVLDLNGDGLADILDGPLFATNTLFTQVRRFDAKVSLLETLQSVIEDRTPTSPRVATIDNIIPGSANAILGDWTGDGETNILWLNPTNNTFESYSWNRNANRFAGDGPFPLSPAFTDASVKPYWTSQKALDVDGDGLTDLSFIGDPAFSIFGPTPDPKKGIPRETFFSERDMTGRIHPFSRKMDPVCHPDTSPLAGALSSAMGGSVHSLADMDGDGLADLVVVENVQAPEGLTTIVRYWKNRGDGRYGVYDPTLTEPCWHGAGGETRLTLGPNVAPTISESYVFVHDLNGDGVADVLVVADQPAPKGATINAYTQTVNSPAGAFAPSVTVVDGYYDFIAERVVGSDINISFGDFRGSGTDDVLIRALVHEKSPPAGTLEYLEQTTIKSLTTNGSPSRLQSIRQEGGATVQLDYSSAHSLGLFPVRPTQVVTKVTTTNGRSDASAQSYVTNYEFNGPVYDARDRAFLGFESVKSSQAGDPSGASPGGATKTTFADSTCIVSPAQHCAYVADYGYRMWRGLPYMVEELDETGRHKSTAITQYKYGTNYSGLDGRSVRYIFAAQTDTYLFDAQSSTATSSLPIPVVGAVDGAGFGQVVPVDVPSVDQNVVHLRNYLKTWPTLSCAATSA